MAYDEQSQMVPDHNGDCLAFPNAPASKTLAGVSHFLSLGVDPSKLVLGVPWYGYVYDCLPGSVFINCRLLSQRQMCVQCCFSLFPSCHKAGLFLSHTVT